jgi:hypothetical protein
MALPCRENVESWPVNRKLWITRWNPIIFGHSLALQHLGLVCFWKQFQWVFQTKLTSRFDQQLRLGRASASNSSVKRFVEDVRVPNAAEPGVADNRQIADN